MVPQTFTSKDLVDFEFENGPWPSLLVIVIVAPKYLRCSIQNYVCFILSYAILFVYAPIFTF